MKKTILFLSIIISIASVLGQNLNTVIKLCDLQPTNYNYKDTTYQIAVENSFNTSLVSIEPIEKKKYVIMANSSKDYELISCHYHPFIEALHSGYANHRGVVISPDMIWLLISQGFANHVNENSETLRKYFVTFEGKKVLKVKFDELPRNEEWEKVISAFNIQIIKYTGEELSNTVVNNFSTTTHIEESAFRVTLMDAMSQYFIYSAGFTCGIPEIQLEGTSEDWEKVRDKAKLLRQYELAWWIDSLAPVLEQFVLASKGEINVEFWNKIHSSEKDGCTGKEYITGWVNKFFPYINQNGKMIRQTNFKRPLTPGNGQIENNYKMGMSKAEVYLVYDDDDIHQLEFLAGFTGMKQQSNGYILRPEIGWLIRDTREKGIKEKDKKYAEEIKE